MKLRSELLTPICVSILLLFTAISCSPKSTTPAVPTQTIAVQRGNLEITASVDGNLVMPQAFDLHFGAPGNVKDVLVEEGDHVKAGSILATLDDTTQTLAVQSANNAVQTVLSKLYETVPLLPQFPTDGPVVNTTVLPDETVPISGTAEDPIVPKTTIETTVTPTGGTNTTKRVITIIESADGLTGTKTTKTTYIENANFDSKVNYPSYYPNSTTLTSFAWAQDEASIARDLLQSDNYAAAASQLYVVTSDLETCVAILQDAINNPDSGLGGMTEFVNQAEAFALQQDNGSAISLITDLQNLVDRIKQSQADLDRAKMLIAQGKYAESGSLVGAVLSRMQDTNSTLADRASRIERRNNTTVYGKDISLYLYGAAEEKLNAALAGINKEGLNSPDLNSNLVIAQHYMKLCNAILGSNDYVLQHGLSLKNQNQYNIDLANALVTLEDRKNDFLNTVILSPYDGIVVSVGVKKNDVLSAVDYSSKGTISVVDTTQIKFQGTVDEIDILKVKKGQKANITVDAIPNKVFTGKVSFISPYGTADTSNVVKFNVTVLLDPTDIDLKGGLSATAAVAIDSADNVLLVPLSAVTTTAAGSFVSVMNDVTGQPEKRQVTLGKQNQQYTEVSSGLNEGDKIVAGQKAVTGAPVITRPQGPPAGGGSPPGGGR